MGIGTARRELVVSMPPGDTFARALEAMESIGDVKETDESDLFIRGTTHYRIQLVRLKVTIHPADGHARVLVRALADDLFGSGARYGCKTFIAALEGDRT